MAEGDFQTWAALEFGSAELGDIRRTRRLVDIAARAAEQPAGKITEVFADGAEREAAFRLVENDEIHPDEMSVAARRACAARAADFPFVFVPVDGSSLNLTDWQRQKRLGVVGARSKGAQGLKVMSALAVSPDGVPLGICGQEYWARPKKAGKRQGQVDNRHFENKETVYWLTLMAQVRSAMSAMAAKTIPWFQLDRGGDAWPVVLEGVEPGHLFTVRASHNRRLWECGDESRRYLWEEITSAPVLGEYELSVAGGPGRKARKARMEVRATEVTLRLQEYPAKRVCPATLFGVMTREVSSVPADEKPIEWLLLTTYEARTFGDAQLVIRGYAQRWRIEEFHRIWKTGRCNLEDTQLGDRDHVVRWAMILASVAARLLRINYLGRNQPDLPASIEFERAEIDAVIMLRKPKGRQRGTMPTVGEVVHWLADIGGYTGKSSGGPPGAIVIGRGLQRIQSVVQVIRNGDM